MRDVCDVSARRTFNTLTARERKNACALHDVDPDDQLSYASWHERAEARGKAGEKQRQCSGCGLFIWERLYFDLTPDDPELAAEG